MDGSILEDVIGEACEEERSKEREEEEKIRTGYFAFRVDHRLKEFFADNDAIRREDDEADNASFDEKFHEVIVRIIARSAGKAADIFQHFRKSVHAAPDEEGATSEGRIDAIAPNPKSPSKRAVRREADCVGDPFLERNNKEEKEDWNKEKGSEHSSKTEHGEEKKECEENDPSDAGIGKHEHDGIRREEHDEEKLFFRCSRKCQKGKKCERDEREEIEAEYIRVAECSVDPGNAHAFVLESDGKDELIESNSYRQDRRCEKRKENFSKIFYCLNDRESERGKNEHAGNPKKFLYG